MVARAGRALKADAATVPEDAAIVDIVQRYADLLALYNDMQLGVVC